MAASYTVDGLNNDLVFWYPLGKSHGNRNVVNSRSRQDSASKPTEPDWKAQRLSHFFTNVKQPLSISQLSHTFSYRGESSKWLKGSFPQAIDATLCYIEREKKEAQRFTATPVFSAQLSVKL